MEGLESRKLLAAAIMNAAHCDHVEQPAALVNTTSADSSSAPIKFIVNGQQTSGHESVGVVNGGCTGTLISPTHVLTAAHCVEGDSGGFIGDREGTFMVGGETYKTVKITVHPKYSSANFDAGYDMAIMELDRPVTGVTPSDINRTAPQVGQTLTLVGFGEAGSTSNPDFGFGTKHVGTTPIDSITNKHISWTLDNASEAATAPGDSGGPAFVSVGGKLVVAGVTSGGSGDAHSIGAESFDTRVDTLASWIDGILSNTTPVDPPGDPTDEIDDEVGGGDVAAGDHSSAQELAMEELDQYDADGNESLSLSELTNEFADYGFDSADATEAARELIDAFDADNDGELSLAELVVSWGGNVVDEVGGGENEGDNVGPGEADPGEEDVDWSDEGTGDFDDDSPEQLAKEELQLYDTNQNGSLSAKELTDEFVSQGLSKNDSQEFAEELIDSFDADNNQELDLFELIASWGGESTVGGGEGSDPDVDLDTEDGFDEESDSSDPGMGAELGSAQQLAQEELELYDINQDGSLDIEELTAEMVAIGLDDQEAERMAESLIDSFDADGNNLLSYSELVVSWGGSEVAGDEFDDSDGDADFELDDIWGDDGNWWESAFAIDF